MTSSAGAIGPNFDQVDKTGTTVNGVGAKFNLGAEVAGPDGTVYRYVQAAEAITSIANNPLAVAINNEFQAVIADAGSIQGGIIGWAPSITETITDNSFFWARIRGAFKVRAVAGTLPNARLRLSGAGLVATGTATTVSDQLLGIRLSATASGSASAQDPATRPLAISSGALQNV